MVRCSLSSKSVLKELLCNLQSFQRNPSSLFSFRFIDFSYACISFRYREFLSTRRILNIRFNPAGEISILVWLSWNRYVICNLHGACILDVTSRLISSRARRSRHSDVLGSGVCLRKTNSPRPGYHLRGTCQSSPAPRRSAQCRPCNGRKSLRQRRSLASRGRLRRKTADPRTVCQPTAQTA